MAKRKTVSFYTPPQPSRRVTAGRVISVPRSRRSPARGLARNLFGQAASAIASTHPVGRAALGLYRGYRAVRSIQRGMSTSARGRNTGGPNARLVGPFKRPKRFKGDVYATKGFRHTTEIRGTVSDPDCVYIGHSTFSGIQTLELLCQVLLRKLFARAGVIVRDIHEGIRGYQANTSNMWRMVIVRQNKETGAVDTSVTYTTPFGTNTSIYQIVGDQQAVVTALWPGLYNVMYDAAVGANGGDVLNVLMPTSIVLYQEEENNTQFFQFRAELKLENETVNIFSKSDLKIQNRSLASSGGTTADAVDANPLMGKLYRFNGGAPRARVGNVVFIESVPDMSGVITTRASNLTGLGAQYMTEPPGPKMFWNCVGASNVKLQPGHIKYDSIVYKKSMQFHKFLKAMHMASGPGQRQINLFGKSTLVALEDVINVNGNQLIYCSYEVNREFALHLTTSSKTFALGHKYQVVQNNEAE